MPRRSGSVVAPQPPTAPGTLLGRVGSTSDGDDVMVGRYARNIAAVFTRAVAFERWRSEAKRKPMIKSARPPPMSVAYLPGAGSPTSHVFDLMFGYSLDCNRLGLDPDSTPLSIMGPGASGSIVALNNIPNLQRVYRMTLGLMQEGTVGLFRKPLSPKAESIDALYAEIRTTQTRGLIEAASQRQAASSSNNDNTSNNTNTNNEADSGNKAKPSVAWKAVAYSPSFCIFCGDSMDFLSPAHVLTQCNEPSVAKARQVAMESLPIMLNTIVANAIQARRDGMEDGGLYESEKRIHELLKGFQWCTPDGRYVLFRMLMVAPWPADAVRDTPSPISCELAYLLGKVFDLTNARHYKIRRLANRWVAWASKHASNIARAWSTAIDKRYELVVKPRVLNENNSNNKGNNDSKPSSSDIDSDDIVDDDEEDWGSEHSMMDYSMISDDSDISTQHDADSDYADTESEYDDDNDAKGRRGLGPSRDHRAQGQKGINRVVDARQRIGILGNTNGPILSAFTPPKNGRISISYDTRYSILMAVVERLPRETAIRILSDDTLMRVLLHGGGE
jgi:hypothetical protein